MEFPKTYTVTNRIMVDISIDIEVESGFNENISGDELKLLIPKEKMSALRKAIQELNEWAVKNTSQNGVYIENMEFIGANNGGPNPA